ncbi:MAG: hypothetical protein WC469_01360 [Candidatus Omnitrophota bacterium]
MEAKRPLGITVLGWLFIIAGAFGLSGVIINAGGYPHIARMEFRASLMLLLNGALALASIACGAFLLKLKSWARKLAIILCLANIGVALANFRLAPALLKNQQEFEKNEQLIRQRYKPEYQQEALEEYRRIKQASDKVLPVILGIMAALPIAWNAVVIYYLSRPKLQEKFEENRQPGESDLQ